jgi:hypothetical protein
MLLNSNFEVNTELRQSQTISSKNSITGITFDKSAQQEKLLCSFFISP